MTPANFHRFEVQQRTNGTWQILATIMEPTARTWTGGPVAFMDGNHPVRLAVFDMQEHSAGSNGGIVEVGA